MGMDASFVTDIGSFYYLSCATGPASVIAETGLLSKRDTDFKQIPNTQPRQLWAPGVAHKPQGL